MSGHADKNGLIEWVNAFEKKPARVFIVHGEDSVCNLFSECLKIEHGQRAYAPYSGTRFDLITNTIEYEAAPVLVKKRIFIVSDVFQRLLAAGQRLMSVIHKNEGGANKDLAKFAGVPVWNGLTNEFHPTQILADFLTIREQFGTLKGIKLVYMGDARYNMGNSLMVGCAKMGMHFVACAPEKYFPNAELIAQCQAIAAETGAVLEFITDPMVATKGADVIYTDVWVSMGEPDSVWQERIEALKPYQVTKALMENAGAQCKFMHCLPAFHDLNTVIGKQIYEKFGLTSMEVTDEVFESEASIVFDEAENRMHTIKAVMAATL